MKLKRTIRYRMNPLGSEGEPSFLIIDSTKRLIQAVEHYMECQQQADDGDTTGSQGTTARDNAMIFELSYEGRDDKVSDTEKLIQETIRSGHNSKWQYNWDVACYAARKYEVQLFEIGMLAIIAAAAYTGYRVATGKPGATSFFSVHRTNAVGFWNK